MKIRIAAIGISILAGCASPPPRNAIDRSTAITTLVAPNEISSARARELALHALSQIGVPYRYGGSTPSEGFDCSGLVRYIYSRAGIALPRTTQAMSGVGVAVTTDELEPGDLVFFDTLRRPFSHVGIYIGDRLFIHAPTSGGAVQLVDMRERYWRGRYDGARRLSISQ